MSVKTVVDCDRCGEVLSSDGIQNSAQVVMYHRSGPAGVSIAYFCYTHRADGTPSCGDQFLDLVREFAIAEDVVPPAPVYAPLAEPLPMPQ